MTHLFQYDRSAWHPPRQWRLLYHYSLVSPEIHLQNHPCSPDAGPSAPRVSLQFQSSDKPRPRSSEAEHKILRAGRTKRKGSGLRRVAASLAEVPRPPAAPLRPAKANRRPGPSRPGHRARRRPAWGGPRSAASVAVLVDLWKGLPATIWRWRPSPCGSPSIPPQVEAGQRRRTRDEEVERPRMRWQAETDRFGHSRDLSARVLLPARIGPDPTRRKEAIHPRKYDTQRWICIPQCGETGSVGASSIQHCQFSADGVLVDDPWYMQEPLYVQWKQWNCRNDCRYFCMMQLEKEREELGLTPVKYHGRWPFKCWSVLQEPVSAILSALTLIIEFNGWLSFFLLSSYKLPLRPQSGRTYYEFTCLWHVYGLLSMNDWFWDAISHTGRFYLTEKLDYLSSVALLGYSLILAIFRTFNVKTKASRVMVAAPLVPFLTTHILYIFNFYELDYGLNMKVYMVSSIAQVLLWVVWAGVTQHPSRFKLWVVAVGGAIAAFLALLYDFPPYKGYVDSHALWHAAYIPLAYLTWSFVYEDAEFRTSVLIKKTK